MENLLTFALIVVLFLAAAVIAYTFITNKIIEDQDREIEDQDREIEDLKTDNERLRSAIRGAKYIQKVYFSDKEIDYPPTAKITLTARDDVKEY